MSTSFNESDHPRDEDGQFAPKDNPDSEATLAGTETEPASLDALLARADAVQATWEQRWTTDQIDRLDDVAEVYDQVAHADSAEGAANAAASMLAWARFHGLAMDRERVDESVGYSLDAEGHPAADQFRTRRATWRAEAMRTAVNAVTDLDGYDSFTGVAKANVGDFLRLMTDTWAGETGS